jgi:hypothetical protein
MDIHVYRMAKNNNYVHLDVKEETKSLVLDDCKKIMLKINPALKGINLTHDYIVKRIATFYKEA